MVVGKICSSGACYVASNIPMIRFGEYWVDGSLDECLPRCTEGDEYVVDLCAVRGLVLARAYPCP